MNYLKMFKKSTAAGFKGYAGTEYEGEKLGEEDSTRKTNASLKKGMQELS